MLGSLSQAAHIVTFFFFSKWHVYFVLFKKRKKKPWAAVQFFSNYKKVLKQKDVGRRTRHDRNIKYVVLMAAVTVIYPVTDPSSDQSDAGANDKRTVAGKRN